MEYFGRKTKPSVFITMMIKMDMHYVKWKWKKREKIIATLYWTRKIHNPSEQAKMHRMSHCTVQQLSYSKKLASNSTQAKHLHKWILFLYELMIQEETYAMAIKFRTFVKTLPTYKSSQYSLLDRYEGLITMIVQNNPAKSHGHFNICGHQ